MAFPGVAADPVAPQQIQVLASLLSRYVQYENYFPHLPTPCTVMKA